MQEKEANDEKINLQNSLTGKYLRSIYLIHSSVLRD